MTKAMTLRLPDEVHEALRRESFDRRMPITQIVLDAIEHRHVPPSEPVVSNRGLSEVPTDPSIDWAREQIAKTIQEVLPIATERLNAGRSSMPMYVDDVMALIVGSSKWLDESEAPTLDDCAACDAQTSDWKRVLAQLQAEHPGDVLDTPGVRKSPG